MGGFGEFGFAGFGAGDEGGGGLGDRAGDGGAAGAEFIFGLFPAHALERAGDDVALAGERSVGPILKGGLDAESAEFLEDFEVVFVGKVSEERSGDDLADIRDLEQVVFSGFGEGGDGAELLGEGVGGLRADVTDAEGGDELVQRWGFGGGDGGDEILGGKLSKTIKGGDLFSFEFVEIGDGFDEAGVDEGGDVFAAEALDIERGLGSVILDGTLEDEIRSLAFDAVDDFAVWAFEF